MGAGTFKLYNKFASQVFRNFRGLNYGWGLRFSLQRELTGSQIPEVTDAGVRDLYLSGTYYRVNGVPDPARQTADNPTVVYEGSTAKIIVPKITFPQGYDAYIGTSTSTDHPEYFSGYWVQVYIYLGASYGTFNFGFIDLTPDGGVTGIDMRTRDVTLTFPSNVMMTAKVTHA